MAKVGIVLFASMYIIQCWEVQIELEKWKTDETLTRATRDSVSTQVEAYLAQRSGDDLTQSFGTEHMFAMGVSWVRCGVCLSHARTMKRTQLISELMA